MFDFSTCECSRLFAVPLNDVLGTLSVLLTDAVARDRALVPILDFARDCFQIVRDGFRAFAGVCPPLFSITVAVPNSTDQDRQVRNSRC